MCKDGDIVLFLYTNTALCCCKITYTPLCGGGSGLMPLIHPKKKLLFFLDRSYMRLTEKENETLPIDVSCNQTPDTYYIESHPFVFLNTASLVLCFQIVLQTLLSFVITCYGIVHISGEFKDMDASSELKNK